MTEKNLTKKYRPLKFGQIIGQQGSVQSITASIQSGIIPPAYLFFGTRGCGKTSAARLTAMSLNCKQKSGVEPCGTCPECTDIINDNSSYLRELDGATNGKVDDIRNLMTSVKYVVPDGNYKVVIIDECHMLTKEAWNAALKTIEEPPKNVMFIFCTTELQKVIPAVKSRCVPIQFPGVQDAVVADMLRQVLKAENVPFDEESVALIAKYAYGSIRDAQSILEGFIRTGKVSAEQVKRLYQTIDPNTILTYFNNILSSEIEHAVNMANGWLRLGAGPELIVSSLLEHLRNMVMDFTVTDKTIKGLLKAQREKIGEARLVHWIEFFYNQLRFIREFPMEHTLVIDLITIKLVGSLTEYTPPRSKKSAEKSEAKKDESPLIPADNATEAPLNTDKVKQLADVCHGSLVSVHPKMLRATIRNAKGTTFDVVSSEKHIVSDMYLLGTDLDAAISGYPGSMASVIKRKQ